MNDAPCVDLDEVYNCCRCDEDPRPFARVHFQPKGGIYRKHPPIGMGREVAFVNINPRSTNNAAMEWAMESRENFHQFAKNSYKGAPYIPGGERFYDIHARITDALFPGRPFEEVASVHELYLCATEGASGLPGELSPCAERFLWPWLKFLQPKIVVTFGHAPANFFNCSPEDIQATPVQLGNAITYILPLAFRRSRSPWSRSLEDAVIEWVRLTIDAVGEGRAVPQRAFSWPTRSHASFYVLRNQTPEVEKNIGRLAPQAQACIQIMRVGGKLQYTGRELRALLRDNSAPKRDWSSSKPLHTDQDPWRVFDYYCKSLIQAGAIKKEASD